MFKKIINYTKKYYIQKEINYDIFLSLTGLPLLGVPIIGLFYILWYIGRDYLKSYQRKKGYEYKKSLFYRLLLPIISFIGSIGAGAFGGDRPFLVFIVISIYQVIESFMTTNEEFANIKYTKITYGQRIPTKRKIVFFCLLIIIFISYFISDRYI